MRRLSILHPETCAIGDFVPGPAGSDWQAEDETRDERAQVASPPENTRFLTFREAEQTVERDIKTKGGKSIAAGYGVPGH